MRVGVCFYAFNSFIFTHGVCIFVCIHVHMHAHTCNVYDPPRIRCITPYVTRATTMYRIHIELGQSCCEWPNLSHSTDTFSS